MKFYITEETKQECKDCNKSLEDCTCIEDTIDMKQETLEEVAERLFNNFQKENPIISKKDIRPFKLGFIKGTKWQQERMYSEEDLKSAFFNGGDMKDIEEFNYWFKQFKKK